MNVNLTRHEIEMVLSIIKEWKEVSPVDDVSEIQRKLAEAIR